LSNVPGFLVDLRSASGGDERKASEIAHLFCSKDTVYAKSKYRKGAGHDQFTKAFPRLLKASDKPYTKPVVCLIGPGAVSSGEAFVQMMKCLPHVTTVGLPTRGASGNPRPFELEGLGVSVWFSRWVDLMPDDALFEGVGIAPDVKVDAEAKQYTQNDPTLEKALEVLRRKVKRPE
jgi:C-terminal processing protease CtpA/Prc